MHRFVTEMCTHVHISVTKWCIVGYGTGASWDLTSDRNLRQLGNIWKQLLDTTPYCTKQDIGQKSYPESPPSYLIKQGSRGFLEGTKVWTFSIWWLLLAREKYFYRFPLAHKISNDFWKSMYISLSLVGYLLVVRESFFIVYEKFDVMLLNCHWNSPWWRHQMETFSALLAICAGNSPVPGEFPTQRPVTRSFDVFFDVRPNKQLSKQSWGWWFETLSPSLWRHRNAVSGARYIGHK